MTHKKCKPILLILALFLYSISTTTNSYYFWLKSSDNTPEDIAQIEENYKVNLPIVSFIFDPREKSDVLNSIDHIVDMLWNNRIYHFTLSPDEYSAKEVSIGLFDTQYASFFQKIKDLNLHVIFRTMHEMNWWRYPWSSNPEEFKDAWIHVRSLARGMWLSEENIIFDFSVNHRDMPTAWTPSQSAKLTECNIYKENCRHLEDYYPWDEFVDVVWISFYNRWKANSNRLRLTPEEILYDKNWKTYERLQQFGKPIIIDEVATTSVRYEWLFNYEKSKNEYLYNSERKDYRLEQLQQFLVYHPEIIAAIYFNCDYTRWLDFQITWEADRAIINLYNNKFYNWFRGLDLFWEKDLTHILKDLYKSEIITINWESIPVPSNCSNTIQTINKVIEKKASTTEDKIALINKLKNIRFKDNRISIFMSPIPTSI